MITVSKQQDTLILKYIFNKY